MPKTTLRAMIVRFFLAWFVDAACCMLANIEAATEGELLDAEACVVKADVDDVSIDEEDALDDVVNVE